MRDSLAALLVTGGMVVVAVAVVRPQLSIFQGGVSPATATAPAIAIVSAAPSPSPTPFPTPSPTRSPSPSPPVAEPEPLALVRRDPGSDAASDAGADPRPDACPNAHPDAQADAQAHPDPARPSLSRSRVSRVVPSPAVDVPFTVSFSVSYANATRAARLWRRNGVVGGHGPVSRDVPALYTYTVVGTYFAD